VGWSGTSIKDWQRLYIFSRYFNQERMMTLPQKIKALYPTLTERDFYTVITLQNDSDGKGDYIAKWEHPTLARPTGEQLT
jgi:hypothetical protein